MLSSLEKSVLSAIVYFDLFDYPLTLLEIWRWMDDSCSVPDVIGALESLGNKIGEKQGFYFLNGRDNLLKVRMRRYNIAERKYRRVLWVGKILRLMPFARMIAVCNNLALSNARDESDIDLFIVTKNGRIWCCRFFVLLILKILGLRPDGGNTRDKICASFFVTEDNLNLQSIALINDIYLHYWLKRVVPIYDDSIYQKFRKENSWDGNDCGVEVVDKRTLLNCYIVTLLKGACEKFFLDIDERFYRWLQMRAMPKKLKEMAQGAGSEVVINDQMLKFHENDRREYYRDLFNKKFLEVGN